MKNLVYKQLIESFNKQELDDFNAISERLDNSHVGDNAIVISDDPYLSTLVLTSLMRYYHIKIHILNPAEGENELQRLIYTINPSSVILTDYELFYKVYAPKLILIDENCASKSAKKDIIHPDEVLFEIYTYTPFPIKINRISSEVLTLMVESLISDLSKHNLIKKDDFGSIPIITNNVDYFLYFIVFKIIRGIIFGYKGSLPSNKDNIEKIFDLKSQYRNFYFEHNKSSTLIIPKEEFMELWNFHISPLFEYKFLFKSYMKRRWLINLIIKRKLKKIFEGFENVLIIGTINNSYIIDLISNLSFVKFYTVFTMKRMALFGPISENLNKIFPQSNPWKQDVMIKDKGNCYQLAVRMSDINEDKKIFNIWDTNSRFCDGTVEKRQGNVYETPYYLLGDKDNAFVLKNNYIFPETLEKVINSYPFIRDSVLLTFNKAAILVINPNMDVLDSNRINNKMFHELIWQQIMSLNRELPEPYKISDFIVSTSLIEKDRMGDIVRYPFSHCNQYNS